MANRLFLLVLLAAAIAGSGVVVGWSNLVSSEPTETRSNPSMDRPGASTDAAVESAREQTEQTVAKSDSEEVSVEIQGATPAGDSVDGDGGRRRGGTSRRGDSDAQGSGGRNSNRLTGKVVGLMDGVLTIETAEGQVGLRTSDETRVRTTKPAVDAAEDLANGTKVTVIGATGMGGGVTARIIAVGGRRSGGGGGGSGNRAPGVSGTVTSFDGAVLTLATDDGVVAVTISERTVVQLSKPVVQATAELAAGEQITVSVGRDEAGGFTAGNITVGSERSGGQRGGQRNRSD